MAATASGMPRDPARPRRCLSSRRGDPIDIGLRRSRLSRHSGHRGAPRRRPRRPRARRARSTGRSERAAWPNCGRAGGGRRSRFGDPAARRRALDGVDEVVHLAAIVGDQRAPRDPARRRGQRRGHRRAGAEARAAGVERFVFASTCSNYGRMADASVPIGETAPLRPVSLYAEQKVAIERALLDGAPAPMQVTCLRFATVYGVAPRMRFDLTVEPVHARPAGPAAARGLRRAVLAAVRARARRGARRSRWCSTRRRGTCGGEVFNVGRTDENYRKLDLVRDHRRPARPRDGPTCIATRIRATTSVAFSRSATRSASSRR